MPLEHQGNARLMLELAVAILTTERVGLMPPPAHSIAVNRFQTSELDPSPPDLNVLNSTFLI